MLMQIELEVERIEDFYNMIAIHYSAGRNSFCFNIEKNDALKITIVKEK